MSKRARSNIPQFRVRVPAKAVVPLRGKRVLLLGTERPFIKVVKIGNDVSFSLETDDLLLAAARQANALDHLRRLFESDRSRARHSFAQGSARSVRRGVSDWRSGASSSA
ncbi:hypothetical protein PMN64_01575 [Bradyrhizobium sp. UFLA01-814]|uniref:hypothetical protein n=1 Tax=Bradyrhizobium sp. UFLA01-814 TaxID=3023480 RepID=UPI00398B052D